MQSPRCLCLWPLTQLTFEYLTEYLWKFAPLLCRIQISCLQNQRSQVRFQALPNFLRNSNSERCPLILVRINEMLEWIVAAAVLKTEINVRGDPSCWSRDTPLSTKVGTNSPTSGVWPLGIIRLLTKDSHGVNFCNRPWHAHKIEKRRGCHISYKIGWQMAMLLALLAVRRLPRKVPRPELW
jgi:hypothetical protein